MAYFSSTKCRVIIFLASLLIRGTIGELICDELPNHVCAFSVSSSGKRCLLETMMTNDGTMEKQCTTSEVVVEKMAEYIETDECVKACGVDRDAVGISSDAFLEPHFLDKLCTAACYDKCPNLVELYSNLAAGEGVFLPYLCEKQKLEPHRSMREFSSSSAASGPVSEERVALEIASGFVSEGSEVGDEDYAASSIAPGPALLERSRKYYVDYSAPSMAPGPSSLERSRKYYKDYAAPSMAPDPASEEGSRKYYKNSAPPSMAPGPASEERSRKYYKNFAPPSMAPGPALPERSQKYYEPPVPATIPLFE